MDNNKKTNINLKMGDLLTILTVRQKLEDCGEIPTEANDYITDACRYLDSLINDYDMKEVYKNFMKEAGEW